MDQQLQPAKEIVSLLSFAAILSASLDIVHPSQLPPPRVRRDQFYITIDEEEYKYRMDKSLTSLIGTWIGFEKGLPTN